MKSTRYILFDFLCLFILSTTSGFVQTVNLEEKISVTFHEIPLKEALGKIEKQWDVSFAFNKLPELDNKVSASYANRSIYYILNDLLTDESLAYKVYHRQEEKLTCSKQ